VGSSWRDGAVGTGPFRVVSFDPGKRLELERNPYYWREGFPRSEGVVFRFGSR
jgi:peptide/nickel transport system substrate-binding protein